MEAKKTFTAVLFDNSNYEELIKKEKSCTQHSFNAPDYFWVSDSSVMFSSVHGTMTFDYAKSNLELFLDGIPYKEII